MDMLQWGASWLQNMAGTHAAQQVQLVRNGVPILLNASLVDEAGRLLPGPSNLKTEHTKFMFSANEIAAKGVVLDRATTVIWNNSNYQLVQEGNRWYTYNDAYRKNIVVTAKHVSD